MINVIKRESYVLDHEDVEIRERVVGAVCS